MCFKRTKQLTQEIVFFIFAVLGFVFLYPNTTLATTCTYSSSTSNNFNLSENWDCNAIPGSSDVAIIPETFAVTLTAGPITVNALTVTGTLNISTFNLSISSSTLVNSGGVVTSTSGDFTFNGAVTSTGQIGAAGGDMLFSSTLDNEGIFHIGSGTVTTTGFVTNSGTFAMDNGTYVKRSKFTHTGTFESGTGTLILSNSTNAFSNYGFFSTDQDMSFYRVISRGPAFSYFNGLSSAGHSVVSTTLEVESGSFGIENVTVMGEITVGGRLYHNGGETFEAHATTTFTGVGSFLTRQLGVSIFDGDVIFEEDNTGTIDVEFSFGDGESITFKKRFVGPASEDQVDFDSPSTVYFAGDELQTIPASYTFDNVTVSNTANVRLLGDVTFTGNLNFTTGTLYAGGNTVTFSDTGTPLENTESIDIATSTFIFSADGSVNVATGTYYNLTISSSDAVLLGNTTSTNAFSNSGSIEIPVGTYLSTPGTFGNTGTITETGIITHPASYVRVTDSAGDTLTSLDGSGSVYLRIKDDDANIDGTAPDTITTNVSASASTYSDSISLTFTETGNATGIFAAGPFPLVAAHGAKSDNSFQVRGDGSITFNFVDSKDSTDTGSATLDYTDFIIRGGGSIIIMPNRNTSTLIVPLVSSTPSIPSPVVTLPPEKVEPEQNPIQKLIETTQLGQTNDTVKELQKFLQDAGYFPKNIAPTGFYGSITDFAVKQYQNKTFTPSSQSESTSPDQITSLLQGVHLGSTGQQVKSLQDALKAAGYFPSDIDTTGYYGVITQEAIQKYLLEKNSAALDALVAKLKQGNQGNEVNLLQALLQQQGFFPRSFAPTGYYGPITAQAVAKYMAQH